MTTRISGPHIIMPRKLDNVDLRVGQHLTPDQIKGRQVSTLTKARAMLTPGFVIVRPSDGRIVAVK